MTKKIIPFLLIALLCFSVSKLLTNERSASTPNSKTKRLSIYPPPPLISHGGGITIEVDGKEKTFTTTNSVEALQKNYEAGHTLFEVDFQWTSDNKLVVIHDWGASWRSYFVKDAQYFFADRDLKNSEAPTLEQFKTWKMHYGLHQLLPHTLNQWLVAHPDSYIVTDIKTRNIEGLEYLLKIDPALTRKRYIPQIHNFSEYEKVKRMGFERIILTLYRLNKQDDFDDKIVEFVRNASLYAVAVHVDRMAKSNLVERLKKTGAFVYVHPVNDIKKFASLKEKGASGIFSYLVSPDKLGNNGKSHLN